MLKVIKNRIEQGYRTTRYPKEPITLHKKYRGRPEIDKTCDPALVKQCAAVCPQDAINPSTGQIDLGRCVFCGRCEKKSGGRFVRFTQNFELAVAHKDHLLFDGTLPDLARESKKHFKKLFGRSLQLRQVSAAGCNACEADNNVLATPFFDLARFGINFVASPRHADGIHVTGPISKNMKQALLLTYEAVPDPKVVIACGSCPISGGPFHGSEEVVGDLNSIIPVDLYIPGCPPHPLTILHGLLNYFK